MIDFFSLGLETKYQMKITFIYPDVLLHRLDWTGYFYHGVGLLSSVLKQAGHQTSLIHITQPVNKTEFINRVKNEKPDLIGFSSTSHMFPLVKKLTSWLTEAKIEIPTICGGIHPTIAPEESIGTEGIDMICRGEGEASLLELCQKMENKEDISTIPNLWIKRNGDIIKNPLRPLLEDLDILPFPDRDIFSYPTLYSEREGRGSFLVGRGCPYNCTYCCNHLLRKIYRSEGKPVRFRGVANIIREIKGVIERYPFINSLIFDDDILFLYRKWSEEFAEKYRQEVGLPFRCNARADVTDEALFKSLKKAGCYFVKFGLESGNEEIRYKVLNRHMTDAQIKKAFAMSKKLGLITESFNMVGIPCDTPSTILDTIKLNATLGVDTMQISIFQPYPGTDLARRCQEQLDLLPGDLASDFFTPSILKLTTVSPSQVLMFRDYFRVLVWYYRFLQKLSPGISKIFINFSDTILSLGMTSIILNLIYLPLNYVYRKALFLRLKLKNAQRKGTIHSQTEKQSGGG